MRYKFLKQLNLNLKGHKIIFDWIFKNTKMKINILLSILTLTLLFACDPNGKENTNDKNQIDSTDQKTVEKIPIQQEQKTEPRPNESEVKPQYFICYTGDSNANLAISISFDKDEKALKVKYKGQEEAMNLSFIKEDFQKGGAHPNIETYYSEIYNGKENGVYKLTHSGNWDYAEYTRSKDGKKFKFTIDHDLSIGTDGYRTTPCF